MSLANVTKTVNADAALKTEDHCRSLERRVADLEQELRQANASANMYANAWQRELGAPYANKRHHIDAMVLTTRMRIQERDDAKAECRALRARLKEYGQS